MLPALQFNTHCSYTDAVVCATPLRILLKHSPALGVWRGVGKPDEAEVADVVVVTSTEVTSIEVTGVGCTVVVTVGVGN